MLIDDRIVSLEDIVKQNSLLPPIIGTQGGVKGRIVGNNQSSYAFTSAQKRNNY